MLKIKCSKTVKKPQLIQMPDGKYTLSDPVSVDSSVEINRLPAPTGNYVTNQGTLVVENGIVKKIIDGQIDPSEFSTGNPGG
jgi:hypothetical protein